MTVGSAPLACGDHVDVKRAEDLRVTLHRLREALPIHERLVQSPAQRFERRLLHPPVQDTQRLVQRHPRGEQMPKLLGKQELPGKRNSLRRRLSRHPLPHRIPRGDIPRRCALLLPRLLLRSPHSLDLDRETALLLHEHQRPCTIICLHHPLGELAIRAAGGIAELRHRQRLSSKPRPRSNCKT
jgi:hypothetical protein